jgi:hypothetical protein
MKDLLIDFGLPVLLILVFFILLLCGIDGEVKSLLAIAAGWVFKSGITRVKNEVTKSKSELQSKESDR